MTVKLKFFGQLRELTKTDEVDIQLKKETSVGDFVWVVGERYPNIKEHLKTISVSVNSEYATRETAVKDGDEVGLLPPISGG